jgi:hypothetical protein
MKIILSELQIHMMEIGIFIMLHQYPMLFIGRKQMKVTHFGLTYVHMKNKLYLHPIIPQIIKCPNIGSVRKQKAIDDIVKMVYDDSYVRRMNFSSLYLVQSFVWSSSDLGHSFWASMAEDIYNDLYAIK